MKSELVKLARPVPKDEFTGAPSELEMRLQDFEAQKSSVDQLAEQVFTHSDALVGQLESTMQSTTEAGHTINYTPVVRSVNLFLHTCTCMCLCVCAFAECTCMCVNYIIM